MSVHVAMTADPPSGDMHRIWWASNIVPSCFFRIRLRPPAGTWQLLIKHTEIRSALWSPMDGNGTYSFEARLIRSGFGKSGWSNPLHITVEENAETAGAMHVEAG